MTAISSCLCQSAARSKITGLICEHLHRDYVRNVITESLYIHVMTSAAATYHNQRERTTRLADGESIRAGHLCATQLDLFGGKPKSLIFCKNVVTVMTLVSQPRYSGFDSNCCHFIIWGHFNTPHVCSVLSAVQLAVVDIIVINNFEY